MMNSRRERPYRLELVGWRHILAIACSLPLVGCGASDRSPGEIIEAKEAALAFSNSTRWTTWNTADDHKFADVNGDGKADIVGVNGANVNVGLSTGTSFAASAQWSTWSASFDHNYADVNGDGKADLIGVSGTNVQVGLSTGASFAASTQWSTWNGSFDHNYADVNGDGKADLIGVSGTNVQVALSTGAGFAASTQWSTWNGSFDHNYADVNGDGKADLIGVSGTCVQIALSTGTSFGAPTPCITWSASYDHNYADVDGDGKADLIGVSGTSVQVALSTGTSFAPATQWTTWNTSYDHKFADADGNNSADIIGVSGTDVQVGLSGGRCNPANPARVPQSQLGVFPNKAIGGIGNSGSTPFCTGTIIDPWHIATADHCIQNQNTTAVRFMPQFGITTIGAGPAPVTVARWTRGQILAAEASPDSPVDHKSQDWAILTLTQDISAVLGANYAAMTVTSPPNPPLGGTSVEDMGYGAPTFTNRPGRQSCLLRQVAHEFNGVPNALVYTDCDIMGGYSGGPIFQVAGTVARLFGVNDVGDSTYCAPGGSNGALGSSAESFIWAPYNAAGIAATTTTDGRIMTFATDADRFQVMFRNQTTDAAHPWTFWQWQGGVTSNNGSRIAATNLADNRMTTWVIDNTQHLQSQWMTDTTFTTWTAFQSQPTPVTVKDVAASGGAGVTTHLFVLGTNNVVYYTYKTGDSNSPWSAWRALGMSVSGARAISATYINGAHQVWVIGSGTRSSSGNGASFPNLSSWDSSGSFLTVAAGRNRSGQGLVVASDTNSMVYSKFRQDNGTWTAWSLITNSTGVGRQLPQRAMGIRSMNMMRNASNVPHVFATSGSGETLVMIQEADLTFGPWNLANDSMAPQ